MNICMNNCKECIDRLRTMSGGVNDELLGPFDENDTKGKEIIDLMKRKAGLIPIPESPNWISVKERMPENGQSVICYVPASILDCGYYKKSQHVFEGYLKSYEIRYQKNYKKIKETKSKWMFSTCGCDSDSYDFEDVTHWMPLPEPPKDQ